MATFTIDFMTTDFYINKELTIKQGVMHRRFHRVAGRYSIWHAALFLSNSLLSPVFLKLKCLRLWLLDFPVSKFSALLLAEISPHPTVILLRETLNHVRLKGSPHNKYIELLKSTAFQNINTGICALIIFLNICMNKY